MDQISERLHLRHIIFKQNRQHEKTLNLLAQLFLTIEDLKDFPDLTLMEQIRVHLEIYHGRTRGLGDEHTI